MLQEEVVVQMKQDTTNKFFKTSFVLCCVVLCCVVLCCCWTPAGNYSVLDENVKGANPKNAPFVIRARVVRITII